MLTLQIRLLGKFQLIYDGQPVTTIHQSRQQSLLAYLLLHRETIHARRDIAFLFWPDVPERQAFVNLRKALHRLRRALPDAEQFLQIDPKTVGWRAEAPFSLDVTDFAEKLAAAEAARQAGYHRQAAQLWAAATDLYDGELLPTCYDDWLLPERERLHQQFIVALTQLGDWQETRRDYPAAIRTTQRLLRHDPLYEVAHRRLMQLHLLNGEPAEALRVYHTCTSLLQQELNVDPSPATQEIYDRLLSKSDRALEFSFKTSQHLTLLPLVGRQPEWQQLLNAWKAASRGPRCAIIGGEAGIGKSRLAEELQLWAKRQGFTTAHSRAYEGARSLAYAPVADWLRSDGLQPAWQTLEPVWLAEIARLLPELLTQQPDLPRPQPLSQSWQRRQLFEALSRAVLQATPPLLLVLDDLQWCDQETLEWLGYLLRFDQQARLLLVGTVRIEEIDNDHPLTALRRDLRRAAGLLAEIELGPLTATETTTLAEQVTGHPLESSVVEQLYQETEGNPLFIVETVRAGPLTPGQSSDSPIRANLPPRIQAVIEARLDQLSPPARELVNVAAVIGREFTFDLLAATSPADLETVVNALDEAWQRRIIKEQGSDAYDFSHDKIREVVYAGLSPARRRWLHQTAAQAIETMYKNNLDQVSSQVAAHYEQAGQDEKAVIYYGQAAQAEHSLGAWSETIVFLQRALDLLKKLPDTPAQAQQSLNFWALLGATYAAQKGYSAPEVGNAYQQALTLVAQTEQSPSGVLVHFWLGIYHFSRGDLVQAQEMGETLLALAQDFSTPMPLKLAHHLLGITRFQLGQIIHAREYLAQNQTTLPSQTTSDIFDTSVIDLSHLALALWFLGYPDQALQKMTEAIKMAEALPDPMVKAMSWVWAGWLSQRMRQVDQSRQYAQAGLALCRKYDLAYPQAIHTMLKGWATVQQTKDTAEIETIRCGLDDFFATDAEVSLTVYLGMLAEAYQATGQIKASLETLDEAIAFIQRSGERLLESEIYRLQGELRLAQSTDNQADAETDFQHAMAVARRQQAKSLELRAAMSLARLWQQQGKIEPAHALLSEIYGWFSEGFDTHDLQAAKQLLAQLSSP